MSVASRSSLGGGRAAWLSADFVLVECPMTTRTGAHSLAGPYAVIWGDPVAADSLPKRAAFTRAELADYVAEQEAAGVPDPVQAAWDELAFAVRGWRRS